ncbi:MAG: hypothetical protein JO141_12880 [Bradyrhizobium sp.]|nr:hypothetical protein [Bradyrhizobium sp.]
MRRSQRLIAASVLIVFSTVLAGCSSSFGSDFDPTDLLDWLDTKKKLPGERKPVFPEGVPGMEQGVPKELYKGAQQQDDPNAQALAAPPPQAQPQVAQQPLEPPPGSPQAVKRAKAKAKSQAAPAPVAAEPDGETAAASQGDGTQATAPAPKKKIVRRRTTAPPPDPNAPANQQAPAPQASQPTQSSQSAFPAPLPGGQFSR